MAQANLLMKRGKAKRLGIEGYRQMTDAQLDAAIAKASAPAPTKGKTATATVTKGKTATAAPAKGKVSTVPSKGKTASTTPTKGKTTTAPAAKSTARKSSTRSTAAKGKVTRQSASPVKTTARKTTQPGRQAKPVVPVKAKTRTTAKAAANGTRRAPISKEKGTRVSLDAKGIDWKAESTVGTFGKRKDVLSSLRKHKGNYDKVYADLSPNWKTYYPKHSKTAALKLLRWLIARVAFDFAVNTEQHEMGARRAYGTATNGSATKTTATKAVKKAASPRKAAAVKATATRAKAAPAARKPAQRRTAAPAAKRGGKVTSGRR